MARRVRDGSAMLNGLTDTSGGGYGFLSASIKATVVVLHNQDLEEMLAMGR